MIRKGTYVLIIALDSDREIAVGALGTLFFRKGRYCYVGSAMGGYKEINYRAMKLLPRGGYLATCSCSHFATPEKFVEMLHAADFNDIGAGVGDVPRRIKLNSPVNSLFIIDNFPTASQ